MNMDYAFLTVEHVLRIHSQAIAEFGGTPEVRDHGLLESAVFMPQAKFGGQYLHEGVPAMAAAYLFHLCKNHAFVDGNKRTALATAVIFIEINHYKLVATDDQLEELTLGVACSSIDKNTLTQSFQKRVRRARSSRRK
jgi:death-on-curing protein